MAYYTNVGPVSGPLLYHGGHGAIGILRARNKHLPIGMALSVGRDDQGVVLWRLSIGDAELPRLWLVIDREFRPAQ